MKTKKIESFVCKESYEELKHNIKQLIEEDAFYKAGFTYEGINEASGIFYFKTSEEKFPYIVQVELVQGKKEDSSTLDICAEVTNFSDQIIQVVKQVLKENIHIIQEEKSNPTEVVHQQPIKETRLSKILFIESIIIMIVGVIFSFMAAYKEQMIESYSNIQTSFDLVIFFAGVGMTFMFATIFYALSDIVKKTTANHQMLHHITKDHIEK